MNANTPATRALHWMKVKHPHLFKRLKEQRPDLIRDAAIKDLNGIGGVDGIFDDILGFAKQAIPVYQQQKTFTAQLKQASRAPTPQAAVATPAAPVSVAPYSRSGFSLGGIGMVPLVIAGAVVAWFLLKPKRA